MNGYKLSRQAIVAESRWETRRIERKDIMPWRGGELSTENGDNFIRNQATISNVSDALRANSKSALGLSATWACINLLAGTIASLPLMVYRNVDGVRTVAKDHPLYWLLHESPNYDQTDTDFWEFMAAGIELQGNAYAEISRRGDGVITSLTPIRPDAVRVKRRSGGSLEYRWTVDGIETVKIDKDILHIRGPLGDATSGASTLSVCRSAFDSAIAADTASETVFSNGIRPSGILSTRPEDTLNPVQRQELEELLNTKFRGAMQAGRPMLLDRGLTWTQLDMSPEDAQMIETRGFGVEEICRIFGVPPHMVGHTANSTSWGTGLEQQTLGFVKFSLRRRLKRIEQALKKQLLTRTEQQAGVTIEFNLEGLLRGDSAGRAGFYQTMTQLGAMTINEVRALENLPPVAGGDVPRMQMQNVPITQAGTEEE